MTPATVGDWVLIDALGEGTYGHVARARKRRSRDGEVDVAIKVAKLEGDSDGLPGAFVRELAVLAGLPRHASVVPLLDSVLTDIRHPSLVLGLAQTTLAKTVRQRRHIGHVELFERQLFAALAHFEHHGILHRDIKPENILVDVTGPAPQLMVADFGLARFIGHDRCMTLDVVTLWYRAPEVLLGDDHYGHAVDIFAAGVTVAFMVDAAHLFQADCEWGMLMTVFGTMGTPPPDGALSRLPQWDDGKKFPTFRGKRDQLALRWKGKTTIPLLQTLDTDPAARPTARAIMKRLVPATR